MADPNNPDQEPPGEVRSNLQVVVRVVLAVVVLALLIGLGVALVRLLSRPDPLTQLPTHLEPFVRAATLLGAA